MFEVLFKYPVAVFAKGSFVLLGSWPLWLLIGAMAALWAAAALPYVRKRISKRPLNRVRAVTLWLLQSSTLAVLLLLLWEPAISITALRPQENIVAVVVDNSRSMGLLEQGRTREQRAIELLQSKLLPGLSRFQVRFYALGAGLTRIESPTQLQPVSPATDIAGGLKQLADEAGTLPIGSVVLLSDGSDTTGGVDLETLNSLRRRRLPVNAVGFGADHLENDVEMEAFSVASKVLQDARVEAEVTLRQDGYAGRHATLTLAADNQVVASRDLVLNDAPSQVETLDFHAGKAGVRRIVASVTPLPGEASTQNNRRTAVMLVSGEKHRLLYVEGEPRWEYKFLRRAVEDDPALAIVSMLRTTQNKIYRQGISSPSELEDGFPSKPQDLFGYDGIILGSVESGFFTPEQQAAIRDFVDRRGGGLLFLGGRAALADGDYAADPFRQLLPVKLPSRKGTFERRFVAAELTDEGKRSLICRIDDNPEDSVNHWNVMPYLADMQDPGTPKPGATVLADADVAGKRVPLLITENYGRGRTAVFATGGSWRWRMQQPVADTSHQTFWRQLLRWTGGSSPSRVVAETSTTRLEDSGNIALRAEVRDETYNLASSAEVTAHVVEPDGGAVTIKLLPDASAPGIYAAEWKAEQAGSYVAEISAERGNSEFGRDVITFGRENGVAENFHREQNRELLSQLAEQTGGHYYAPSTAGDRLPQEISFSDAGITARETKDLWNMPAVFLLILALRSCEWLLRRKWGLV